MSKMVFLRKLSNCKIKINYETRRKQNNMSAFRLGHILSATPYLQYSISDILLATFYWRHLIGDILLPIFYWRHSIGDILLTKIKFGYRRTDSKPLAIAQLFSTNCAKNTELTSFGLELN